MIDESKIQVGDQVVIRDDLVTNEKYKNVHFVSDMERHLGQTGVIKSNDVKNNSGNISFILKDVSCYWSSEMFSKHIPKGTLKDTPKTNPFKAGDIVKIKPDAPNAKKWRSFKRVDIYKEYVIRYNELYDGDIIILEDNPGGINYHHEDLILIRSVDDVITEGLDTPYVDFLRQDGTIVFKHIPYEWPEPPKYEEVPLGILHPKALIFNTKHKKQLINPKHQQSLL